MSGWFCILLDFAGVWERGGIWLVWLQRFLLGFVLEVGNKKRTDSLGFPHGIQLHIKRERALYSLLQFS